jgi:branched-chain amino acid transport system permease protein
VLFRSRGRFGRRLTALGDSPAACATLGVNQTATKLTVFVISAAIAGFGGALLGILQGTATVQDFQMLNGLGYLLLLVVGGVAVVSGAILGGIFFQSFTWLSAQFPASTILEWWSRLGPGLAGIGIGRQPSGIIPTVSEDVRHQRARKRALQAPPPPPDSVGTVGTAAEPVAPAATPVATPGA